MGMLRSANAVGLECGEKIVDGNLAGALLLDDAQVRPFQQLALGRSLAEKVRKGPASFAC